MESFPVISIRQPWAFAIINNRHKCFHTNRLFPAKLKGKWLALHCSSAYTEDDRRYSYPNMPNPEDLKKMMGKILGIVKFGESIDQEEITQYDPATVDYLDLDFHVLIIQVQALPIPLSFSVSMNVTQYICRQKSIVIQLIELVEKAARAQSAALNDSDSEWSSEFSDEEMRDGDELDFIPEDTEEQRAHEFRLFKDLPPYKKQLKVDKDKVARAMGNLTSSQMKRFEAVCRSTVNHTKTRNIMGKVLDVKPSEISRDVVICTAGVTKLVLAEIVEKGLLLQSKSDVPGGPLRPVFIREAVRRLQKQKMYTDFL